MNENEDESEKIEEWIDVDYEDADTTDSNTLYDITSSPNDFNVLSYKEFVERNIFILPRFQRSFVWDLPRASKLIESLIMGLPVPQIFLFEDENEKQLIIDGQQRLLSIIYFIKGKFPKQNKRTELREKIINSGNEGNNFINDDELLNNTDYFQDFKLKLKGNKSLNGKTYKELEEIDIKIKNRLDLRTLRSIFIKQTKPENQSSSMYEIFYRLNTGGINLKAQEVRRAIYDSPLYNLLDELNKNEAWRNLLNRKSDKHQRDTEIILRCIALSLRLNDYKPSMTNFLNNFSQDAKKMNKDTLSKIETTFNLFMEKIKVINKSSKGILLDGKKKFYSTAFDAIFVAFYLDNSIVLSTEKIENIKTKISENTKVSQSGTADKKHVAERVRIAKEILNEK